jgi:hypothetical protein
MLKTCSEPSTAQALCPKTCDIFTDLGFKVNVYNTCLFDVNIVH